MANLGLILAGALAGGAEGAGAAAQRSMYSMQEAQQREDLVKMQSQLDEQKQMRILEAQQTFAAQQQKDAFAHADQTLDKTQQFTSGENALNRTSEEKRTGMSTAAQLEAARIHVGGTLAAERMRIAAQRSAEDKTQVLQTENGPVMFNPKSGIATPITDSSTGKPLGSMKMSQIDSVAYSSAFKIANNPMSDPEEAKAAQAKLDAIANKYSPGGAATTKPEVTIPPGAVTLLKKDPTLAAAFDKKYGAGSSASILNPGKAGTAANPFDGSAPMPGGADPGAGTVQPPLPATRPSPLPAVRPSAGLIGGAAGAIGTNTQAGIMPGQGPVDAQGRPIIKNYLR